jgi:hypothetical protein
MEPLIISSFIQDYNSYCENNGRFQPITNFNQIFIFSEENCSTFLKFRNYISTLVKADATGYSTEDSEQKIRRDDVRNILDKYIKQSITSMSHFSLDLVSGKLHT